MATLTSVMGVPELRNQIYGHAISQFGNSMIYIVSYEHALEIYKALVANPAMPCNPRRRLDWPSRTKDWSGFGRQYLGLTQVCRQVRTEFKPLYRKWQCVYVQIEDVDRFLDTFVFAGNRRGAGVICRVAIVATGPPRINLFSRTISLYRLIRLRHEAAVSGGHVQVVFTAHEGDDSSVSALNTLLDTTKPAWTNFVAQHVTRIQVVSAHGVHAMGLHLCVQREYFETEEAIRLGFGDILGLPDPHTTWRTVRGIRKDARERWEKSLGMFRTALSRWAIIWRDD